MIADFAMLCAEGREGKVGLSELFSDAEIAEDAPKQIIGGEDAGDFTEALLRLSEVFGGEFRRSSAVEAVLRGHQMVTSPLQRV